MFSLLASGCVQGPWARTQMLEMFPAQDMGASFWLVELFCDGGEETKKRVDYRSTRLRFERLNEPIVVHFVHWLVRRIWYLIKNVQVSPKPFVCWTARFKRDLCGRRAKHCVIEKWWLNLYLISQAARPAACTQCELPSWWEGQSCTKTGQSTLLLPFGHFEMEKRWPKFLLDLASCTTVHAALSSACTVCGSQLMRGSQPFRRLDTTHFCCPFLVCCA